MEQNQQSRSFCLPEAVLDTVAEQLADLDVTLPDYCPDIEKILKCTLTPKISSKSLSGGQVQVDGFCVVNVLYVESTHKTVRCCEQSVNFTQSFALSKTPEEFAVLTRTKPEYVNCRALSPRRLVMHGAFSLYVRVLAKAKTELFAPEDDSLETLTRSVELCDLRGFGQEQFTVSEEVSVADKPSVEATLLSDVSASVSIDKAVSGKLMLSGELNLRLFYLSDVETGETSKLDYLIPFTQIIDCSGADEDTRNILNCEVMSYDVRLKNDMLSDRPSLAVDCRLCVTVEAYEPKTEELVTDAYSTEYLSAPSFAQIRTLSDISELDESGMEKLSVSVEDGGVSKILDLYADSVSLDTAPSEEGLTASGNINLCMLALDGEGFPIFVERSCPYRRVLGSPHDSNVLMFPKASAANLSYRLADDNTAEIRCELRITGGAAKQESLRTVSGVEVFTDKPIAREERALTLYFASEGENLWDIAKSHNTRLSLLMRDNDADSITLDSARMLLIPRL